MGFAIKVNNKTDFDNAVKYCEQKGYKQHQLWCRYRDSTRYVIVSNNDEHIQGSDGTAVDSQMLEIINIDRFAIPINSKEDFDKAVKYCEEQGYKKSQSWCNYHGCYKYVIIGRDYLIQLSYGNVVNEDNLRIVELKSSLKIGDIVTINKGSELTSINRIVSNGKGAGDISKYTVIDVGRKWLENYDIVLSYVDNPTATVFTNSQNVKLVETPIMVGDNKVQFNKDGSIKVGCTTVDAETVDAIFKKWRS